MKGQETLSQNITKVDPEVVEAARACAEIAEGIAVLAAGLESNPSRRLEWLVSIRERLTVISHDLTFARFGLTTGGTR